MRDPSKTPASRMARSRAKHKQDGLTQITVWVSEEQKEFLKRLAMDIDGTLSDAAQALIFKNVKQLKLLGIFK